ncbi:MAG: Crp/Fnr family transcriptional regulator [Actinomycetota bacterium]|nr:Crp/Fnr family transcriptional regulator [Actinomycetota bacterium]
MEWRLLEDVPAEQVRELLAIARRRRFSRNEVVFHRDDPGDSLHLISKGRFAIQVMTPLGDTATIAIRGAGESFGEMALVGGARRSATVLSLEESETLSVYQPDFERLRRQHPAVSDVLIRFLVNEVRMLNERLLEALYVPVEKRVRRRLVELAELFPGADGFPAITLTQEALSELAGAARPTVNKVLREEEKRGTIELARGKTRVLNLDELRKRAR